MEDEVGSWPDEKRIDIIGQNGNEGDHYDEEAPSDIKPYLEEIGYDLTDGDSFDGWSVQDGKVWFEYTVELGCECCTYDFYNFVYTFDEIRELIHDKQSQAVRTST